MFIIDDILNAVGASNAAQAQERNANKALDLQREMWNQQRSDQAPWLQAGGQALGRLSDLMRDPNSITTDPSYQFRMSEGQKALERSAASRGGLNSGATLKGMARYSQGLASEEYGNQWGRLAGLAGMGQGSAQNLGALGSHSADSQSNLYGAIGNAQAAGQVAGWGGAANSVRSAGNLAMLGLGGGMAGIGIPGLSGAGGQGMGSLVGSQLIPRQQGY